MTELKWMSKYDTSKMDYLDFEHYFIYIIHGDEMHPIGDYDTFDELYRGFLDDCFGSESLYDESTGKYYDNLYGWYEDDENLLLDDPVIFLPNVDEIRHALTQDKYFEFVGDYTYDRNNTKILLVSK